MVDAVLDDYQTAPISERDRALFAYLDKIICDSPAINHSDVDRVRDAGWSDDEIYDAVFVCSLFHFFNKWIDATGVSDMPASAYEASGQRMADHGYIRSQS